MKKNVLKKAAVIIAILLLVTCGAYAKKKPVFAGYADRFEIYFESGSLGAGTNVGAAEYSRFNGIKGESCVIDPMYSAEQVIADFGAECVFTEKTEAGVSYYCYSPRIKYREYIGGRAVNLHVFEGKERLMVGAPMIYGSY